MPEGAQLLARFFPLTYTVSGLRGSMLRGFEFGDATLHIVALASMALVLGVLGVILGRRYEGK
jgi:ABC-type multidrug transport system permease subunit